MTYDGPDLETVAGHWGCEADEVVARHPRPSWSPRSAASVPGSPTCRGCDVRARAWPRRAPGCPAGSVALAGTWCGVYPVASPGGWQIIGTRTRCCGTRALGARPARPGDAGQVRAAMSLARPRRPGRRCCAGPRPPGLGAPRRTPRRGPSTLRRLPWPTASSATPPTRPCLEVLLGGLAVATDRGVWVAVTGAPCEVTVDGRHREFGEAVWLPARGTLRLGRPTAGLRTYVAVAGGIAVDPVLGSRSTDTLGRVGPPPVVVGDVLPVGDPSRAPVPVDTPRPPARGPLRLVPGPRADRVAGDAVALLSGTTYTVSPDSDRIGLRLVGDPLPLATTDELPSEGIVLGAVQVPPDGRPVVFLADHPTTGGYPVVAVVDERDLWQCAQLRPGEAVGFTPAARR